LILILTLASCSPTTDPDAGQPEATVAQDAASTVTPTAVALQGEKPEPGACGDGVCDEAEQADPTICPQDCPPPEPGSLCGDGVCDDAEQADPSLCPQDCVQAPSTGAGESVAEPPPEQDPEPEPQEPPDDPEPPADDAEQYRSRHAGTEWVGELEWQCTIVGSTKYYWQAYMAYYFHVAPDGQVTGEGEGVVYDAWCEVSGPCLCMMEVGIPITATVTGTERNDVFGLSIKPWATLVNCVTGTGCPGCISVYQITACFGADDSPLDFYIDVGSRARYEFKGPGQGPEAYGQGGVEIERRDGGARYWEWLEVFRARASGESE
jgi:hypothetical protein